MSTITDRADIVRQFNRFYTHQIGVLQEHLLQSDYSLTELRILYELASQGDLTSTDLRQMLGLDAGYMSRLISGFDKKGLIQKVPSTTDAAPVSCTSPTSAARSSRRWNKPLGKKSSPCSNACPNRSNCN